MGIANRLHGKPPFGGKTFCCHCGRDVEEFKIKVNKEGGMEKICPHCKKAQTPKKK